jgi:hypothetical protein
MERREIPKSGSPTWGSAGQEDSAASDTNTKCGRKTEPKDAGYQSTRPDTNIQITNWQLLTASQRGGGSRYGTPEAQRWCTGKTWSAKACTKSPEAEVRNWARVGGTGCPTHKQNLGWASDRDLSTTPVLNCGCEPGKARTPPLGPILSWHLERTCHQTRCPRKSFKAVQSGQPVVGAGTLPGR